MSLIKQAYHTREIGSVVVNSLSLGLDFSPATYQLANCGQSDGNSNSPDLGQSLNKCLLSSY